jgi:diguanylate cyclase (GGDEF)-like protein
MTALVGVAALVAGAGLGVAATWRWAVLPCRRAATEARLAVADAREELDAERARRDLRDRFERALAGADSEPAALRTGLRAAAELLPDHDVTLLLSLPDAPRVGWRVDLLDGVLRTAVPVAHTPGCAALVAGTTVTTPTASGLDACAHLTKPDEAAVDPTTHDPTFPRPSAGAPTTTSAACVPIRVADRDLGVVCLTGPPGEPPTGDLRATLEWLVSHTGRRLTELRRERDPGEHLRRDPVTGLGGTEALLHRLRMLVRSLTPFCVAVIDVDNYAALVRDHGADGADAALRVLADTTVAALRPGDEVCRVEGPRVAAVLPDCLGSDAVAAIERVRESLVLRIATDGGAHFTCSAGVVESHRASSLDEIVQRADAACTDAHSRGGNRVAIW